jgi:SARP family transcriptional regulator, regulator of embCAB operon
LEPVRFYITGRVTVEGPAGLVDQARLPGRQGRLALVHLLLARHRPVATSGLASAVWGDELPRAWETALRSVVSKLRAVLAEAGSDATIVSDAGCYQLRAPGAWLDVEVAAREVDRAEGALRAGDGGGAWSAAATASAIARRPLLPGEDIDWVSAERGRLRGVLVRAYDVLARVWLDRGDLPLAIRTADELVALEPYRESGTRLLMRAHLAAGDRAEAVRAYERCRRLLADELGVDPDPRTEALYLEAVGPAGRVS